MLVFAIHSFSGVRVDLGLAARVLAEPLEELVEGDHAVEGDDVEAVLRCRLGVQMHLENWNEVRRVSIVHHDVVGATGGRAGSMEWMREGIGGPGVDLAAVECRRANL